MLGDVNISAILDSFSVSYDKRVRPNYGGKYFKVKICIIFLLRTYMWVLSDKFPSLNPFRPRGFGGF